MISYHTTQSSCKRNVIIFHITTTVQIILDTVTPITLVSRSAEFKMAVSYREPPSRACTGHMYAGGSFLAGNTHRCSSPECSEWPVETQGERGRSCQSTDHTDRERERERWREGGSRERTELRLQSTHQSSSHTNRTEGFHR
jgi:hypothetical protein